MSVVVWQRFALLASLPLMIGLVILASFLWTYVGYATCFVLASDADAYNSARFRTCRSTFALGYRICEVYPELAQQYGLDFCGILLPITAALLFFILLGLVTALLTRRKAKRHNHSYKARDL